MRPTPKNFELLQFADAEALARAAAEAWLKALSARPAGQPWTVALSGGRIAGRFFAAAAKLALERAADFSGVHFFWGDERCVPPDDPESNFGLAHRSLLAPLHLPETQIHRIQGELPPEIAAARAENELREFAPPNFERQPILDLVFLGLGEEGHTASLFPGDPESVLTSPAVFRAVTATKPPPRRITLGYPALSAARAVWVLASGSGKGAALAESLKPAGRTPLGRVLSARSHTLVFSDIVS